MRRSITGVAAYRTRLPLLRPYHLSLCTIESFDSLIVLIQTEDGKEGFGETTDCPGYFVQDLSDAWKFICTHGPELPGKDPETTLKEIIDKDHHFSFAATPLLTALETLTWTPKEQKTGSQRIPLLGIVQGETTKALIADAEKLMEEGYNTLKFKVGFSVPEDLDRVASLQAQIAPGIQLRLDANQGYDYLQTKAFLKGLDPEGIELLEQPIDPGAWEDMAKLAANSPIPLMLDEAIVVEKDLDRTIEMGCARAVKLKLMKCGSFAHLERMIRKAIDARLKVILGNGVATDIACLHEAEAASKLGLTIHAGEMNGFLKAKEQFLQPHLRVDKGDLILPSGTPKAKWDLLAKFAVETEHWGDVKVLD